MWKAGASGSYKLAKVLKNCCHPLDMSRSGAASPHWVLVSLRSLVCMQMVFQEMLNYHRQRLLKHLVLSSWQTCHTLSFNKKQGNPGSQSNKQGGRMQDVA